MKLKSPRFATFDVDSLPTSSSSSSTSDGDKNNNLPIRYLEHLSIHPDNPSSRGLVRSMSIHEGLCELLLHDSYHFSETLNTIPLAGSNILPAAIEPLTSAPLLVDKKNGADNVVFKLSPNEKPSCTRSQTLISWIYYHISSVHIQEDLLWAPLQILWILYIDAELNLQTNDRSTTTKTTLSLDTSVRESCYHHLIESIRPTFSIIRHNTRLTLIL